MRQEIQTIFTCYFLTINYHDVHVRFFLGPKIWNSIGKILKKVHLFHHLKRTLIIISFNAVAYFLFTMVYVTISFLKSVCLFYYGNKKQKKFGFVF